MKTVKKSALAGAICTLIFGANGAQAATTSYSLAPYLSASFYQTAAIPLQANNPAEYAVYQAAGWSGANPLYAEGGGGLPATWYVPLGATDSALVRSGTMPFNTNGSGEPANPGQMIIDSLVVGSKAYLDWSNPSAPTNWGTNSSFGLFSLDAPANVTITVSADANLQGAGQAGLRPGFSVWQGWDSAGASPNQNWENNGAPGLSAGSAAPFNDVSDSLDWNDLRNPSNIGAFLGTAFDRNPNGSATLSLSNLAAGNYSIVIGGFCGRAGDISSGALQCGTGSSNQYKVNFSSTAVAAVPVPAAAWLFGAALVSLPKFGRRKGASKIKML